MELPPRPKQVGNCKCIVCGKLFTSIRRTKKTCSNECLSEHRRVRDSKFIEKKRQRAKEYSSNPANKEKIRLWVNSWLERGGREYRRQYNTDYYLRNKDKLKKDNRIYLFKVSGGDMNTLPPRDAFRDKCDICGSPGINKGVCIDHCHTTGKFRGFLCSNCNTMIGMADDNVNTLIKAVEYLWKSRELTPTTI